MILVLVQLHLQEHWFAKEQDGNAEDSDDQHDLLKCFLFYIIKIVKFGRIVQMRGIPTCPAYMKTVLHPGSGSLSYLNSTIPMKVIKMDGAHPGVRDSKHS